MLRRSFLQYAASILAGTQILLQTIATEPELRFIATVPGSDEGPKPGCLGMQFTFQELEATDGSPEPICCVVGCRDDVSRFLRLVIDARVKITGKPGYPYSDSDIENMATESFRVSGFFIVREQSDIAAFEQAIAKWPASIVVRSSDESQIDRLSRLRGSSRLNRSNFVSLNNTKSQHLLLSD